MGGFDIGAVADYFWFALFTALIAVAVLAHRRTVFFHPWPLFIGLSFLWIYGLLNLIDKVPSLRTVPILGIGGIHNVLHDFIFPFFGSLTSISALIWETISRSYHVKDISSRVEQLFNNIISNSPEAVVVYDLRNCVTLWNDEAERLFGYSREEVLGREIWDELVTPEFRGRQIDVWNYLKSKGPIVDYPTPMVSRDQKSLGLRASVFPVKDEKGEIIGRVSIYRRSEEETQLAFWVGSFRSSLDMRRGLRELSGHLRIMVPHDEVILFARDELDETLHLYISTETIPHLDLLPVSSSPTSLLARALQGDIKWVAESSEILDPAERMVLEMARINSCVAVPLRDNKRFVGVLALFARKAHVFQSEHERMLLLLAQHLGPALSNMRLFSVYSSLEEPANRSSDEAEYAVALVSLRDGKMISGNRTVCLMLDIASEDINQYCLRDLVALESRSKFDHLLRRSQQGETVVEEVQLISLTGRVVWAEMRGKVLTHKGHTHVLLMLRDLTERRRMFNELADREQRYRFLLESVGEINDIVYMADNRGAYLYCNKSFEETLGYGIEEFAANRQKYLTDNPLNKILTEKQGQSSELRDGKPYLLEIYDSQQRRVLFEVTEKPLQLQDGSTGLLGVMRNITERRLLEERILQDNQELTLLNERLERLAKVKDEFLANTSHELRTPLNSILGFTTLLLEEPVLPRDEAMEFLGSIHRSSRHLLGLINDILDIAKLESSEEPVHLQSVSLGEVFSEVRSISHVQAREKGLLLEFEEISPERPPVYGDREKVIRILLNLVSNAIKFTPEGQIMVRAFYEQEPGYVRIEVLDTGIGIPKEMQDLVFEAFRQVDGSSTRSHGGTGLGLAICKQLVKLMGGRIWIESRGTGRGTAVQFTLPLVSGEMARNMDSQAVFAPAKPENGFA